MGFKVANETTLIVRGLAAVAIPQDFVRADIDGEERFVALSPDGAMFSVATLDVESPAPVPVQVLSALAQQGQVLECGGWGLVREGEINGLPAAMAMSEVGEGETCLLALYELESWYLVLVTRCRADNTALGRKLMGVVESVRPLGISTAETVSC